MCGIAGIVERADGPPPHLEALQRMIGALRHRGPDELGIYRDARAGLAHSRLSIVDLASGQQPLCNEEGTLWVVFNGEIFNYVELSRELCALGHHFRTRSDTEVIVHAFEQWGLDCLDRFNGQWAFALWDSAGGRLVLARDRLGVRPLYYAEHRGRVLFASEVKALFAGDATLPRAFDPLGLDETFTFWSVVSPRSVFAGVWELEPGHVRVYAGGEVLERAYWQPRFPPEGRPPFTGSLDEAASAVRSALERATALRLLRSDVPVGCYLSGGLDSSLVAALARAVRSERLHTFSIRFEDDEFDESIFQTAMTRYLGSEHHEVVVGRAEIARVFPQVVRHTERPLLRTAPAPMFLLSELVRRAGIKVVLTGEGADEVFAGYDLFREGKVRRFWAQRPDSQLRPRLLERLYPWLARSPVSQQALARHFFGQGLERWREPGFAHQTRWTTTAAIKRLLSAPMREAAAGHDAVRGLLASVPPQLATWSALAQDQYLELRTLLAGYILSSQGDRMLMAHSVEGRFPFLDPDVVELASALPDAYKLHGLDEKHVLKRAMDGLLPEPVLRRKKQPYRAPDAECFTARDAPQWVAAVLDEGALRDAGVFDVGAVRRLWDKCRARVGGGRLSNTDNMALVAVLSTQLLHEQLVRGLDVEPPPVRLDTLVDRTQSPGLDSKAPAPPAELGRQ
jgi:asparagine synthase (glutamine-hydrolysing)